MIKNYGLLWLRKYVHLGAGSNRGTLLGYHPRHRQVDFREQIGVYILYDKDVVPVYVGQAGNGNANLFARLKAHRSGRFRNRWEYFSWFGLRGINKDRSLSSHDSAKKVYKDAGKRILNELEGVLLAAMEPRLNKQGARFPNAIHFTQHVDENVAELRLEDIDSRIGDICADVEVLQKTLDKINKRI